MDGFIRVYDGTRYYQLALKNMMPLTRGVDTLLVKIVVLNMLFLIAMQKLKLVHMTL